MSTHFRGGRGRLFRPLAGQAAGSCAGRPSAPSRASGCCCPQRCPVSRVRVMMNGYGTAAQQATQDYALEARFLRIITTPAIPRPSRNRGICRFYSGEKAPEGEFRSLERPGSLQYHAPSPLPVGLRFRPKPGRGTGVLARLFARVEPSPGRAAPITRDARAGVPAARRVRSRR